MDSDIDTPIICAIKQLHGFAPIPQGLDEIYLTRIDLNT